jgi:hypothetical protein
MAVGTLVTGSRCDSHPQYRFDDTPLLGVVCRGVDLVEVVVRDDFIDRESSLSPQLDQSRQEDVGQTFALDDPAHGAGRSEDLVHFERHGGSKRGCSD